MFHTCFWSQVLSVTLSTIKNCEEFKQQYNKYDFLWKQDLQQTLQVGQLIRQAPFQGVLWAEKPHAMLHSAHCITHVATCMHITTVLAL